MYFERRITLGHAIRIGFTRENVESTFASTLITSFNPYLRLEGQDPERSSPWMCDWMLSCELGTYLHVKVRELCEIHWTKMRLLYQKGPAILHCLEKRHSRVLQGLAEIQTKEREAKHRNRDHPQTCCSGPTAFTCQGGPLNLLCTVQLYNAV